MAQPITSDDVDNMLSRCHQIMRKLDIIRPGVVFGWQLGTDNNGIQSTVYCMHITAGIQHAMPVWPGITFGRGKRELYNALHYLALGMETVYYRKAGI